MSICCRFLSAMLSLVPRLNLTPTPRREKRRSQHTSEQAIKKPRFDTPIQQQQQTSSSSSVSSSSAGCIQICEVDSTGRFVQIKNMSTAVSSSYLAPLAVLKLLLLDKWGEISVEGACFYLMHIKHQGWIVFLLCLFLTFP